MRKWLYIVVIAVITFISIWLGRHWLGNSQSFIQQVVNAVEIGDWLALYQLSHPKEKEQFALTEEKVKWLGENLIRPLWKALGPLKQIRPMKLPDEHPFQPSPGEERYFAGSQFYMLLREGQSKGAILTITPTPEGKRLNFTFFLYTLIVEAEMRGKVNKARALSTLNQLGIRSIFLDGVFVPLALLASQ
ncbi:MAG: hypothetical protein RMK94_13685 [Armatimonadota bacterium]|nr:hypothetical protein [Armatimonadota bacterium]